MKINLNENTLVLDKYIRIILNTQFSNVSINSAGYNFRCNVCNDSKKSKFKKRGWILKSKHPWMYYCFNCGISIPATKWIKQYFPSIHRDLIKEILLLNKHDIKPQKLIETKIEKEKPDIEFIPILKGNGYFFDKAKQLCVSRKIPENIWQKWYISVDDTYKNRLIIPFYDRDNKIYYFQARALYNTDNKYLNMVENREEAIYNYYFIDREKPVIVTEGIIDSLFVENSIALLGTKWPDEVQNKINDFKLYFILDNDKAGKDKAKTLLKSGHNIFMWKHFMKKYNLPKREKWDLNDICIYLNKEKFTFEELKEFFTNSLMRSMWI